MEVEQNAKYLLYKGDIDIRKQKLVQKKLEKVSGVEEN